MLKVFVYWNLHRACWSVKALQGLKRGRVVAHASSLSLTGCTFKVSEKSRQRVIRENEKRACWRCGHVGRRDSWRGSAVVRL
jgi:hypothetical protein